MDGGDISGTLITSDKPIAYFTTNTCVYVPGNIGACDCLFQQQVPVHSWGNRFLVPITKRGKERIRIVASQDGTTITQSGATVLSSPGAGGLVLNAGQFVELEASISDGGCYIQSDKPVAVASFLMGLDNPGLYHKGDPAMAFVPPIEQTVMNVALAPFVATGTSVLKEHHALIMTPTATKSATTMTIGGGVPKALSGGTWTGNAPSGFSFYSMPLTEETSTYYFENAAGLSVLGYGLGSYESYYYLAASSARQLNPAFYLNDIHFEDANEQTYCAGEFKVRGVAQMQLQSGSGAITWFIDGQEQTDARDKLEWTIQSLELDKPYEITMIVKAAYNEVFTLKTKITVVNPQPLKITGERFICPPAQSVTLKAGDGPARYQWYLNGNPITGATQKEWTVTRQNAGQYTVIGFYGTCQSPMSDTVTVVDGCNATLNVTYNGNGSNSGTVPTDEKSPYVEDAEVTVKGLGDLKRTDATFIGWSFTQKQGVITAKSDEPTDLKKENDKFTIKTDTTLYATWAVDKKGPNGNGDNVPDYLQNGVTYNGNGGTGAAPTDNNLYNANTQVEVKDSGSLVRTGAAFVGWSFTQKELIKKASDLSSDLKTKGQNFTITQDTTLFAVWGEDKTGPNGTPDGKPDYSQDGVTYYANGGTGDAPTDNSLYNDNDEVTAKDKGTLAHTEAVFIGWLFNSHALVTKAADVPTGLKQAGDKFNYSSTTNKLYAIWGQDKTGPNGNSDNIPDYLQKGVTYDGNESSTGTAPTDNKRYNSNDTVTILGKNDLTRDKAAFVGWSFGKKALLTTKVEHDAVTDLKKENETFTITTDTTLFAVWGKDETGPAGQSDDVPDYLQKGVTYVGNGNDGGTAPVDNNRYNDSTMVTVKGKGTLTRTQAAFIGWSFSTSGLITAKTDEPSDLMKPDTAIRITSDLTFHAVWAEDKNNNGVADYDEVDITWHPGVQARAGRPKVETVSKGDLLLTSKGFAVNGYVLIGWSPRRNQVVISQAAENSLSPLYKVGGHFTASVNTTLYAVWALDKNNDGIPDYRSGANQIRSGRASLLRGTSEDQIDQTESQLEAAAIRVWAHEGALYIESDRRARAEVYTRSGALYKRIDVAEGQTREPLAEGFYVVVIDGKTHKVIVK